MERRNLSYLVTGHTSGIGAELVHQLGLRAMGVSRSNGYDITTPQGRERIVSLFDEFDVLVNNAYADDTSQNELLDLVYKRWRTHPKWVVNIGSAVTEYTLTEEHYGLIEYQQHKKELLQMCHALSGSTLCVQYVTFGYVGTSRIRTKYPDITSYIAPATAAKFIIDTPAACELINRIEPHEPFSSTRSSTLR